MKIHILGKEGITGKAVAEKAKELGISITNIDNADLIITSPGIPQEQFPETKQEIISEIEFAWRLFNRKESKFKPKIIAVTGTNGKTTVTSLIAHILDAPYCGNIGLPMISLVDTKQKSEVIIAEVSSYQLEFCKEFKPDIAIWLNLTPDHLERHKTMENYAKCKAKVFQNFTTNDYLIYPPNDKYLEPLIKNTNFKKLHFDLTNPLIKEFSDLKIKGNHNKLNALASYLATEALLKETTKMATQEIKDKILTKIKSFEPVEHRIELVTIYNNREFYNDSKATNPDSTEVAVDAFTKPINLIICGKDKMLPLEDFILKLHKKVKNIIIFGAISDRFTAVSQKLNPNYLLHRVENIDSAIEKSYALSEPGDVILFSPACSSFDQFKNFEERGKIFKNIVKNKYEN